MFTMWHTMEEGSNLIRSAIFWHRSDKSGQQAEVHVSVHSNTEHKTDHVCSKRLKRSERQHISRGDVKFIEMFHWDLISSSGREVTLLPPGHTSCDVFCRLNATHLNRPGMLLLTTKSRVSWLTEGKTKHKSWAWIY